MWVWRIVMKVQTFHGKGVGTLAVINTYSPKSRALKQHIPITLWDDLSDSSQYNAKGYQSMHVTSKVVIASTFLIAIKYMYSWSSVAMRQL